MVLIIVQRSQKDSNLLNSTSIIGHENQTFYKPIACNFKLLNCCILMDVAYRLPLCLHTTDRERCFRKVLDERA